MPGIAISFISLKKQAPHDSRGEYTGILQQWRQSAAGYDEDPEYFTCFLPSTADVTCLSTSASTALARMPPSWAARPASDPASCRALISKACVTITRESSAEQCIVKKAKSCMGSVRDVHDGVSEVHVPYLAADDSDCLGVCCCSTSDGNVIWDRNALQVVAILTCAMQKMSPPSCRPECPAKGLQQG